MIDFNNASFLKLLPDDNVAYSCALKPILSNKEDKFYFYASEKESFVFTNKRIIIVQNENDNKTVFTSLPYNRIHALSIDTAEYQDQKINIELCFSGLGVVNLEFYPGKKVHEIYRMISDYVL